MFLAAVNDEIVDSLELMGTKKATAAEHTSNKRNASRGPPMVRSTIIPRARTRTNMCKNLYDCYAARCLRLSNTQTYICANSQHLNLNSEVELTEAEYKSTQNHKDEDAHVWPPPPTLLLLLWLRLLNADNKHGNAIFICM